MDITRTRRQQSPAIPEQPPRGLFRSKSRSSPASMNLSENNSCSANTSQRSTSSSRSKSRIRKDEENVNPLTTLASINQKLKFGGQENREGNFVNKLLQPGNSVNKSPSAWALSPGRYLGLPVGQPECSPGRKVKAPGGGGGVGGVFRYFKQKKVSLVEAEDFHRFRVLQNRLLQWRFVNARAETNMIHLKLSVEDKLFTVWLRNLRMRNCIVERRIEVQRLKNEIKIYRIIYPQIYLLNEWSKLEKRNQESVYKLGRTLSGLSIRLPLVQGVKADVVCVYQAMSMAERVMDSIKTVITDYLSQQVEKVLYMVTERLSIFKEQEECLEELEKTILWFNTCMVKEESVRVQQMQSTDQLRRRSII